MLAHPPGAARALGRRALLGSLVLGSLSLGGGLLGCSGDTVNGPPPLAATQAYWALQLNHHAVTLALTPQFDTVQLQATPVNGLGGAMTGVGKVTFGGFDTSVVAVSATGLVTVHGMSSGTPVVASLTDTLHGVTHQDTVLIQVLPTVPTLPLTLTMQPQAGDSAIRAFDLGQFPWPATVMDATPAPVTIPVYYTSSNPTVAGIDSRTGAVTIHDTGHVVFSATALAFGQALRDTVAFTIGYSLQPVVHIELTQQGGTLHASFAIPRRVVIGVGATVTFTCAAPGGIIDGSCDHPVDVTFDHTDHVDPAGVFGVLPPTGSGNIPAFGGVPINGFLDALTDYRARQFTAPGTYRYWSTMFPSDTFQLVISTLR